MKQLATWKLINNSLQNNVAAMLLYVLDSIGSSPGRKDFCMAVNENGEMEGSMGGGIMEHKFVEMAKAKLSERADEASVHKQVHDKSAARNQSGMICSGEQTIFLYKVQQSDKPAIEEIINTLTNFQAGTLRLSPQGIVFEPKANGCHEFIKPSDEEWKYQTTIGYTDHLYIVGGGHCALAFSKLMQSMGFYIHLYDDRQDLHTMQQNDYVQDMQVIPDYSLLNEIIPEGDHYVVIMTFGYRTDDIALRSLMHKRFKYLGVLGSKSKIEKMFSDYRAEGIDERWLRRIHAPIGLPIKSETPEEIAVSIAAEIIQVKNKEA